MLLIEYGVIRTQEVEVLKLVLRDLNADMEQLARGLNISVVTPGDLVLAGEARLGQLVGAVVRGAHLGPGQA